MENKDKLVTIAEFESSFDAGIAKMSLESNGIKSVIFGEDLIANMPTIGHIKAQLQVFSGDAAEAKKILDSSMNQAPDEEGDLS